MAVQLGPFQTPSSHFIHLRQAVFNLLLLPISRLVKGLQLHLLKEEVEHFELIQRALVDSLWTAIERISLHGIMWASLAILD